MTFNIFQIILGVVLIIIAFKLFKKITKMVFFILMLAGVYSFSHGLIDVGTVLNWWSNLF